MKLTVNRFFLLSLLLVSITRGDEAGSTLSFSDKTTITGSPQSANGKDKSIKLTSPSLEGEVTLKTHELLELTLDGKPPAVKSDHYALATITPRYDKSPPLDTIRGRLLHLDEKTVTLETSYAGELTLNRLMVKALDIYSQSPSFYNGPNGPDGWVTSGGKVEDSWTFNDRSMTSKGRNGIARKLDLPDRSTIKFTAKWKTSPYFRILFLSDDGESDYPGVSYSLDVQMSYLRLYRTAIRGQRNDLITESINNLRNTQEAVFTIYLDRSKDGTSAIYIGEDRIGTWTGMDDTKDMGEWLHFVPQQNRPMNFSNITISQWDGILPKSKDEESSADTGNEFGDELQGQKITLANGDVVIGEIKLIEDDFVQASTEFGDVRIPLNRMSGIDLADIELDNEGKPVKDEDGNLISLKQEPRMWAEDIRAWFHEGGSVTIRMATIEDGKIKGSSQVFGEAEFDLNAFSRLEFNIWRRQLDPARYGSGESW